MRVSRLTRRLDIERVRSQGQTHGTPLFVAFAARSSGGPARVGIAAGRRIGGAVQRNRAKRLLREGIRPLYPALQSGWDVLLLARTAILDVKSTQVTPHLERALTRLSVIQAQVPNRETKAL